ncbi:MAG: GNAT family N-acetyltransferase [Spirochaetes bacterium]|nr:GNAT family N-acetyltransferase [Spirochaetota bacterium]
MNKILLRRIDAANALTQMETTSMDLIICSSPEDFLVAKSLTLDYVKWLDIDLSFQDINGELDHFNELYSKPDGCFLYIKQNNTVAGGGAFRELEPRICEMKRLFVYPEFQGNNFGKIICDALIQSARDYGYSTMRLDTIPKLDKAIKLYERIGFYYIDKYRPNPDASARFMELAL